jgi:membrane-bound lytic murein transglycosylase MltF
MSTTTALIVFIARLLVTPTHQHIRMANTYAPMIVSEMDRVNSDLDPKLIAAMIMTESSFDPKGESYKGAIGLMGIMPNDPNAKKYTREQLLNPRINIRVGLKIIEDSRKSCRRIVEDEVGYVDPRIWLSRYAGYGCQESTYADNVLWLESKANNS